MAAYCESQFASIMGLYLGPRLKIIERNIRAVLGVALNPKP